MVPHAPPTRVLPPFAPSGPPRLSPEPSVRRSIRRFMANFPEGAFMETFHYLRETEVHTYAFSVAANALLSFLPFMVVLLVICRKIFHSPVMANVVLDLLREYLPAGQDFVIRNLNALVGARRGTQVASIIILLVTSSGIFLPLEVALNRVWGISSNRSYLMNQLVSTGLAAGGGGLALLSIALTAGNVSLLNWMLAGHTSGWLTGAITGAITFTVMKISAIAASIAIFFLIYWLLPNGKVPARRVLPAAVMTGLVWEVMKYAYILALPWLDFQQVYGPFALSVTILFWAFLSGLLLLAGARLSATGHSREIGLDTASTSANSSNSAPASASS